MTWVLRARILALVRLTSLPRHRCWRFRLVHRMGSGLASIGLAAKVGAGNLSAQLFDIQLINSRAGHGRDPFSTSYTGLPRELPTQRLGLTLGYDIGHGALCRGCAEETGRFGKCPTRLLCSTRAARRTEKTVRGMDSRIEVALAVTNTSQLYRAHC